MGIGKAGSIVGALAFAAALAGGTNAYADANLTLTPVSTECTHFWAGATIIRTVTPCTLPTGVAYTWGPAFTTRWTETWSVRLTYDFTYTDDGLPLGAATVLDPALPGLPPATFEAGVVSVSVEGTTTYGPLHGIGFSVGVSTSPTEEIQWTRLVPSYPTNTTIGVLGLNDHPDQISGRLYVDIGMAQLGDRNSGTVSGVTVTTSVAAVPEPSTYALSLVGLAAVVAAAKRRRDPRRPRANAATQAVA